MKKLITFVLGISVCSLATPIAWKFACAQDQSHQKINFTLSRTLMDSTGANCIAFSPNGALLASGSDKNVRLWDARSGRLLHTMSADIVGSVAFAPDGRTVAAGDGQSGRRIKLWTRTGQLVRVFSTGAGLDIHGIAFTSNGKTLFSTAGNCIGEGCGGTVSKWNVGTGKMQWEVSAEGLVALETVAAPDGKTVFVSNFAEADSPAPLQIRDTSNGRVIGVLAHGSQIGEILLTPDRKTLIGAGHTVEMWDVRTKKHLRSLKTGRLHEIAISSNGALLACLGYDNIIHVRDAHTGASLFTISKPNPAHYFYALAFSPDGKTLATAGNTGNAGEIRLWKLR